MTTKEELEAINKEHFKNPNDVKFCMDCNLKEKMYCSKCSAKQRNKLNKPLFTIEELYPESMVKELVFK